MSFAESARADTTCGPEETANNGTLRLSIRSRHAGLNLLRTLLQVGVVLGHARLERLVLLAEGGILLSHTRLKGLRLPSQGGILLRNVRIDALRRERILREQRILCPVALNARAKKVRAKAAKSLRGASCLIVDISLVPERRILGGQVLAQRLLLRGESGLGCELLLGLQLRRAPGGLLPHLGTLLGSESGCDNRINAARRGDRTRLLRLRVVQVLPILELRRIRTFATRLRGQLIGKRLLLPIEALLRAERLSGLLGQGLLRAKGRAETSRALPITLKTLT